MAQGWLVEADEAGLSGGRWAGPRMRMPLGQKKSWAGDKEQGLQRSPLCPWGRLPTLCLTRDANLGKGLSKATFHWRPQTTCLEEVEESLEPRPS